jgi:hypothetical protein
LNTFVLCFNDDLNCFKIIIYFLFLIAINSFLFQLLMNYQ